MAELEYVLSPEHREALLLRAKLVARACGAIVLGIGTIVILGWLAHIELLETVLPDAVSMKFNSAISFVLLGYALVAQTTGSITAQRISIAVSALVVVIAFVTLGEYDLHRSFAIDQLIVRDTAPMPAVIPGRMAVQTALALLIAGVGFLTLDLRVGRYHPADMLAALVATLGVFGLAGYLFGARGGTADALPFLGGMAIHTAAALIIVAVGLFAVRPQHGFAETLFSPTITAAVGRRWLLGALLIPLALGAVAVRMEADGWLSGSETISLLIGFTSVVAGVAVVLETRHSAKLERRRLDLERDRDRLIGELETAIQEVRTLSGLLPICSHCKKIRDEDHGGKWERMEEYISYRSEAKFSHSICPECMVKYYGDLFPEKR